MGILTENENVILVEVTRQNERWGPAFNALTPRQRIRFGIAVLKDELYELVEAWREERESETTAEKMLEEITQVAAVAYRLRKEIEAEHIRRAGGMLGVPHGGESS